MPWLIPLVAAAAIQSHIQPPAEKAKQLVKVSLLPRDTKVKPGDTLQVGVVFDVAKDWHIYWPGQSDSGTPTAVTLKFPDDSGFTAGAVCFPVPKRHLLPGDILDYVLDGRVVLTVPVKVPETAVIGRKVAISAHVDYLVCNESCLPGDADATVNVLIAEKTEGRESSAKTIDQARAAQPKAQADGFDAAAGAAWEADPKPDQPATVVITAKDPSVTRMAFYPAEGAAKLLDPIKTGESKGKTLRLSFEPGLKPVDGVIELTTGNTSRAWTFHLARPAPPAVTAPAKPATDPQSPPPKGH